MYRLIKAHKHQTQDRQGAADSKVQPPIMANREDSVAIGPLGRAEKAHAEDTTDERGW